MAILFDDVDVDVTFDREEVPEHFNDNSVRRKYTVTLEHEGNTAEFDYYGPAVSTGAEDPAEYQTVEAIMSDAIVFMTHDDMLDFADTFGYDDNDTIRRVWSDCEDTADKLHSIGLSDDDIHELQQAARQIEERCYG